MAESAASNSNVLSALGQGLKKALALLFLRLISVVRTTASFKGSVAVHGRPPLERERGAHPNGFKVAV